MEKQTINGFQAIEQMRALTKQGKTFSVVHATYSTATDQAEGIVLVRHATLRGATPSEYYRNTDADLFLNYYNHDINLNRKCYKRLIMKFNETEITWT